MLHTDNIRVSGLLLGILISALIFEILPDLFRVGYGPHVWHYAGKEKTGWPEKAMVDDITQWGNSHNGPG